VIDAQDFDDLGFDPVYDDEGGGYELACAGYSPDPGRRLDYPAVSGG